MSGNPRPVAQSTTTKAGRAPLWRRIARVVALTLFCLALAAPASQAQNEGGLTGFLQHLFGFGARPAPNTAPNAPLRARAQHKTAVRKKTQDFISSTATRAPGTPGGAPV